MRPLSKPVNEDEWLAPCPFCGGWAQEILATVGDGHSVVEQRTVGCWASWCLVQPKVSLQKPLSARRAWNIRMRGGGK